jgi:hypothetical protein
MTEIGDGQAEIFTSTILCLLDSSWSLKPRDLKKY